jgi:galactonate dehydratase
MRTAASVHLDTAIPNFVVQEYSLIDEGLNTGAFAGVPVRQGGYLPIPQEPGIGISLDESKLVSLSPLSRPLHHIPTRSDGSVTFSV